jgi:hypothetical protein
MLLWLKYSEAQPRSIRAKFAKARQFNSLCSDLQVVFGELVVVFGKLVRVFGELEGVFEST